ncbi:hypothetical protein BDFB_000070 [Asbolus verrucosus]|uniref:C2H2-type domain-containing protein n=1 Tax=Asbolus verrucosus TaxID=1661398 RepID=A0A482V7K5_ASBVE|nr:hypothetical protein BDFB_000070 [Asbolus verrucosus]
MNIRMWDHPAMTSIQLLQVFTFVQKQRFTRQTLKMGMWDGFTVSVSLLQLRVQTQLPLHQAFNRPYQCPKCPNSYKHKRSLSKHLKWECGKDPQFQCSYCTYASKYKYHYVTHMATIAHTSVHSEALKVGMWESAEISLFLLCLQIALRVSKLFPLLQIFETQWPFKCPKCFHGYKHKSSLNFHLKWECGIASQFHCSYCIYSAKQKNNLIRHMTKVHKIPKTDIKFNCKHKHPTFITESGRHACGRCGSHYKRKADLRFLHKSIKENAAGLYVCPNCKKTYKFKSSVYTHLRNDCGKVPRYHCAICNFYCKFYHVLQRHYLSNTHHFNMLEAGSFVCDNCGRAYKRKSSLYNHRRWECGKEPQFKCSYCPYKGKQKIHFVMHVMAKHKEHKHEVLSSSYNKYFRKRKGGYETPFPCLICGRQYKYKSNMTFHMKKCGKDKRFQCEICEKKFTSKYALQRHNIDDHSHVNAVEVTNTKGISCNINDLIAGKNRVLSDQQVRPGYSNESLFACRHCGKRYRWKSTMRRHEQVECGGKEPMFQCPQCPYRAKQKGNLGVHIRKHHPQLMMINDSIVQKADNFLTNVATVANATNTVRPCTNTANTNVAKTPSLFFSFVEKSRAFCPNCNKSFKNMKTMKYHMSRDCGSLKSYVCDICMYACKRKFALDRHIRRRHLENCPRVYSHYTSRSRHLKYECGKSPTFECNINFCPYVAKRKGHLKTHMIRKHNVTL